MGKGGGCGSEEGLLKVDGRNRVSGRSGREVNRHVCSFVSLSRSSRERR